MQTRTEFVSQLHWEGVADRRANRRVSLCLESAIEQGSLKSAYAVINNISIDGFAFTSFDAFSPGRAIWINLPPVGRLAAEVIWDDGVRTGCRFVESLPREDFVRIIGSQV